MRKFYIPVGILLFILIEIGGEVIGVVFEDGLSISTWLLTTLVLSVFSIGLITYVVTNSRRKHHETKPKSMINHDLSPEYAFDPEDYKI